MKWGPGPIKNGEAIAEIKADKITVSDERVITSVAVRYGAEDDMGEEDLNVNLGNAEGLPASPFTIKELEAFPKRK